MAELTDLITSFGYLGVSFAVFAESGVFLGAFLPGDSLLFTVGLLASQAHFNIFVLWILVTVCAILGDNVGYATGAYAGPRIFTREDSLFFRKSHVQKADAFYKRYGKKALILARFVPIVRTFTPILAGVAHMHYPTFMLFNIIGGVLWSTLMLSAGYLVGKSIPGAGAYLEYIIFSIIAISILPIIIEFLRERAKKSDIA